MFSYFFVFIIGVVVGGVSMSFISRNNAEKVASAATKIEDATEKVADKVSDLIKK